MYTVRVEFTVPPANIVQFEDAAARLGAAERGQRGVQGFSLWNSVGSPTQYVVLARAENREVLNRMRRSDAFRLAVGGVTAVANLSRAPEVYEVVFDAGTAGGQFLSLSEWNVIGGPEGAAAFEARMRQMAAIHEKAVPGWLGTRLRRSLAAPNRYLTIRYASALEGAQPAKDPPAVQEFRRANPPDKYASGQVSVGTFESVFAIGPRGRRVTR